MLGNGTEFGLKHLHYSYQRGEGGIAEAIDLAEHFAGGEKVIIFLGDNIIGGNIINAVKKYEKQKDGAMVLLKEVNDPQNYGVVEFKNNKIVKIVEKPKHP